MTNNREQKGDQNDSKLIPFPPYSDQILRMGRFLKKRNRKVRDIYYEALSAKYSWFRAKGQEIIETDDGPSQPSGTDS